MSSPLSPLTADAWARVQSVFAELSEIPSPDRIDVLERLDGEEPTVAAHVRRLLRAAEGASELDGDVGSIVAELLADGEPAVVRARFGPYRLVRPLGRGGMGVVYLGHRDDLDAPAAIKLLPNAWIDPGRREQFVEEMRILATLSHESIARLLHAGQLDDGTPWFAMEYVDGEPITDWTRRNALTARQVLALFDRLCAAVQHAHGLPVIHRDLKPSNVLVTPDGAVKLLDFGIAKRFHERPADDASRTATREVTMMYAAPEQLRGKVAGVRADVYALGVMLHELLAGGRPYDVAEHTPAAAVEVIRTAYPPNLARALRTRTAAGTSESDDSPPAAALRADERRDLDALLSRAMAPDAAERYGSVEELRGDLQRFLERRPLRARKAGWRYRVRKLARRRWRELAAGTAVIAAALAGIALHNRSLAASRDVAIAEAARTNRLRQYLEDLFQGGSQPTGPLDSIRVATLVENGIREARSLSNDPALQVDLLGTLGVMSQRLGALPRADSLLLAAADRARALYGADHPETLRARVRRARLIVQLDKRDSAEGELRAVERLARRHEESRHPVVAEAQLALGVLLREQGRLPDAIAYLERASEQERRRDSTSREYAAALRELGNALGTSGALARADSLWLRALPLVRRQLGARHPDVAFLLANLGNTASQRGRLAEAERYQREAVELTAAWYGGSHYLTAAVQHVLAQTLIRLERYDEAIALVRPTIDIFARSSDVGPGAAITHVARSTLARAFAGRGEHREAAREYERALEGLRRSTGDRGVSTVTVAANLATEHLRLGRPDSAVAMLRRTLATAIDGFGETHVLVANVRVKLGEALAAKRAYGEAIAETTAGLRVLDGSLGPQAATTRGARATLLAAYEAVGDSANAARVRSALAAPAPARR